MREIRFRAYDKKENEMFYSSMYQDKTSMAYGLSNFLSECSDIEDTLMQYTGLKDKDGVEIYEGDILKLKESKEKYEIRYLGNRFVLCKYDNIVFEDEAYFSEREVIGNIYENKELLNK